jgi:hypothetical protein
VHTGTSEVDERDSLRTPAQFPKDIIFLRVVTVISVLFFSGCILQAQSTAAKKESSPDSARIRCTASIKDAALKADSENQLAVGILNSSPIAITITSLTVYLSPSAYMDAEGNPVGTSYAAYVNLETKEALVLGSAEPSMKIQAGREEVFSVNLSPLHWSKLISSLLPFRDLKSVETGKYQLFVGFTEEGKRGDVKSNLVPVTLRAH